MTGPGLDAALVTDLYQLTMGEAYLRLGMQGTAAFELFVRRLPPARAFLLVAGLAQAIEFLETLHYSREDLEFLSRTGLFSRPFLDHLATLRFTGSVHAMREGTIAFPDEPLLRVTAPLLEAQLVESRLLNLVHFQTVIASKAARAVLVARGRRLVDFGMRRAHGAEAAVLAARAAYIAGFDATATVEAGRRFDIPLAGTVAHSFVQAMESETAAFRAQVALADRPVTMLIDTYDTLAAAHEVVRLCRERRAAGLTPQIAAVRIDSGDLAPLSKSVRAILDAGDSADIRIVASGGVDEQSVAALLESGAPIDAFGIGTALGAAADAPALDMAYKIQEYAGRACRKQSTGKATWPGIKQVFREYDSDGCMLRDTVALLEEAPGGEPLLHEVMRAGRACEPRDTLAAARARAAASLAALPPALRTLRPTATHSVAISDGIQRLTAALDGARAAEQRRRAG